MSELPPDGFYGSVTEADYFAWPAANFSVLKEMARSAAHCNRERARPKAPTDAMKKGSALDYAIFDPEKWQAEFVRGLEVDRRSNANKQAHAAHELANQGKTILKAGDYDEVVAVSDLVRKVRPPTIDALLNGPGVDQAAILWTDPETGVRCKGRADRLAVHEDWDTVVEVKSTVDAKPGMHNWMRQVAKFGYHQQGAWYLSGLEHLEPARRQFVWVAFELKDPFCAAVHRLSDAAYEQGLIEVRRYLREYAKCLESGRWPGYPDGIHEYELPTYRRMTTDEIESALEQA